MCDVICVTNRKLCKKDFLEHVESIAKTKPKAIILREKDLKQDEYMSLAEKVMNICKKHDVWFVVHFFSSVAFDLKADSIHLPLDLLRELSDEEKSHFTHIGTSCHSLEDATQAEKLGCDYIIAGHIFNTDCKKGVPARGLSFLSEICNKVNIPVYAIGGISHQNFASVIKSGAKGGCVMSGFMECEDVAEFKECFKSE